MCDCETFQNILHGKMRSSRKIRKIGPSHAGRGKISEQRSTPALLPAAVHVLKAIEMLHLPQQRQCCTSPSVSPVLVERREAGIHAIIG